MATSKEYKDFILGQLELLNDITCKPMMGEYLLYYNGILFGGIYDDRLLVKKVENNKKYNMKEELPYEGAKTMYLVEDVDNKELLKEIIIDTSKDLWGDLFMSFSENLMRLRKQKELSQEEFANEINVTRQTVSKWELGISTPDMDKLVQMASFFGITVDDLVNSEEATSKVNNKNDEKYTANR